MGYESRLYVVEKSQSKNNESNMYYGEIIAIFNLCKVSNVADKMCVYKNTDAYIYSDDGNTQITRDEYGEHLKEVPLNDAIEIIESAMKKDPDYRRFMPCLLLLKGFDQNEWNNLVVLHYGY